MLETAEVGNRLDKDTYKKEAPGVRTALLAVQERIATTDIAPIIVIGGAEGAGRARPCRSCSSGWTRGGSRPT